MYGVYPQAWGPLVEGKHGIFTHSALAGIGERRDKSPAQVALRWNVQREVSVIPKSVRRERMEENFDIWDFALTDNKMVAIAKMDLGRSEIVDYGDPAFVRMLHGVKIHE